MKPDRNVGWTLRALSPLLCAGVLALAGCGGDFGGGLDDDVPVVATLLDDDGNPNASEPAAVPTEPAARARLARHAGATQAAALEAALPGRLVPVVVDLSGPAGEARAAALAVLTQRALGLGLDAPVLVYGEDAAAVAHVADRLVALGHTRVWGVAS